MDLSNNVKTFILRPEIISRKQAGIVAISCATTLGNKTFSEAIKNEFLYDVTDDEYRAAQISGALMTMSNIYFRAGHMMSVKGYGSLAQYDMEKSAMSTHNIDKGNFELACIAVSTINGCGLCLDSHEMKAKSAGITAEQINHVIKIAAILKAVAVSI